MAGGTLDVLFTVCLYGHFTYTTGCLGLIELHGTIKLNYHTSRRKR